MLRALHRLLRSERGTAAVEFALIAPFMLLIAAGIVEIGLTFKVNNSVNRLASQYAIGWSDCYDSSTTCADELANYWTPRVVKSMAPQLDYADITKLKMLQVTRGAGNTFTVDASKRYSKGGTDYSLSAAETTLALQTLDPGNVGVVVTVTYNRTLQFFDALLPESLEIDPSYTVVQLKY